MFTSIIVGMTMSLTLQDPQINTHSSTQNTQQQTVNTTTKVDNHLVANIVNQVAVLADAGDFVALQNLYADEVTVDYSSLNGQSASLKSAEQLMIEWSGVLPGFDATSHKLSNVVVRVDGDRASATADIVADHFVDGLHWQVSGNYFYELHKDNGHWKIVFHQLNVVNEKGTRDVFALAIENANANPSVFTLQQQAKAVVKTFLVSLETKNMALFESVWTEDAIQDMPYSPKGFPKRVSGKENLLAHYAAWPNISGRANFTDNLRFYPMQDPSVIFVEYDGSVEILTTQRDYNQRYAGLFYIEDGKISLFREYYDPNTFTQAFGLDEGGEFN